MYPISPNSALLIVDVQVDFCPGGALAVPNGDRVVDPINLIAGRFDYERRPIFASRDWHPEETNHFSTHGGPWPPHCIKETFGSRNHVNLRLPGRTWSIFKGIRPDEDGYSPFDGGFLNRTNDEHYLMPKALERMLRAFDVSRLYICGLATDYCVKAAALDAVKLGFEACVVLDACRAVNVNPGDEEKAVAEMRQAGVEFTTTEEILGGSDE